MNRVGKDGPQMTAPIFCLWVQKSEARRLTLSIFQHMFSLGPPPGHHRAPFLNCPVQRSSVVALSPASSPSLPTEILSLHCLAGHLEAHCPHRAHSPPPTGAPPGPPASVLQTFPSPLPTSKSAGSNFLVTLCCIQSAHKNMQTPPQKSLSFSLPKSLASCVSTSVVTIS